MAIQYLDPKTKLALSLSDTGLSSPDGIYLYPLVRGAYRFAPADNYTQSFGFQWNKFRETQIDKERSNSDQSRERFFAVTQWDKEDLSGQAMLELGSGAGRFTHVVLNHTQAHLYSVDYSDAVSANYTNNGPHERLQLFQASIYELPFAPQQFDKVFCFGVLQHTPDFKASVKALVDMVKPGGELMVDFYPVQGWYTKIHAKYFFRPLTKRMNHEQLLALIDKTADFWIAAYKLFDALGVGKLVNRFLPICDIKRTLPHTLDKKSLREWVVLDTFDMFSPEHDHPQTLAQVLAWFKEFGLSDSQSEIVAYGDGNKVFCVKGRRTSEAVTSIEAQTTA